MDPCSCGQDHSEDQERLEEILTSVGNVLINSLPDDIEGYVLLKQGHVKACITNFKSTDELAQTLLLDVLVFPQMQNLFIYKLPSKLPYDIILKIKNMVLKLSQATPETKEENNQLLSN